ncbi:hypothetical protein NOC27_2772 [Nitrosococcus oceani AFC27]|nr:hypothetical protein NOC27_2772 [Nitrosococcus oceani AFC27]
MANFNSLNKQGIGLLLEDFPIPIIPVLIKGSSQSLLMGKQLPRLRTFITITFNTPLDCRFLDREGEG